MSSFLAAWTLIHEGTHFFQIPQKDESREEQIRIEYEAFVAEAEWIVKKQEWITPEKLGSSIFKNYATKEKVFKNKDGKYEVNYAGIRQMVIDNYITPTSNPGYRRTKYAYEGPPIKEKQITGW